MSRAFLFRLFVLLIPCSLSAQTAPAQHDEAPGLPSDTTAALADYLESHFQTPEEYVVSKFNDHDVVFLGEWHRIRHDPVLVRTLIPLLYRHGVYYLGYEFARRTDQPLIDSMLAAPKYDESTARLLLFRQFVHWGYQEYADIFRGAWELNHTLPEGSRRFRILGLNNSPDWSLIRTPEDRESSQVMMKVWHGETEEDWAKVLLDSVIAKGEKALVYSGSHHAFTEYRQPIVVDGKFIRFGDVRAGNYVFRKIGKRAMTIYLHAPWFSTGGYDEPMVLPADGYIDAALRRVPPEYRRVGFDLENTPFGELPGETSLYRFGYERFTLDTIYDGYICQGPLLPSTEGVTPIADFVNERNVDLARAQSPNPGLRNATPEEFNEGAARDADIPRRFLLLKGWKNGNRDE